MKNKFQNLGIQLKEIADLLFVPETTLYSWFARQSTIPPEYSGYISGLEIYQQQQNADDLKTIYSADTEEIALENLEEFAKKWNAKYPAISKSWYNRWDQLNTLFGYTKDIRKAIYTTNAIESLNMTLRKVVKNKRSFPNDTAVFKTLYLAIQNISKRWTMPIRDWAMAYQQMLIKFGKI